MNLRSGGDIKRAEGRNREEIQYKYGTQVKFSFLI